MLLPKYRRIKFGFSVSFVADFHVKSLQLTEGGLQLLCPHSKTARINACRAKKNKCTMFNPALPTPARTPRIVCTKVVKRNDVYACRLDDLHDVGRIWTHAY